MNKKIIIILLLAFGLFIGLIFIINSFVPQKTDWETKYGVENKSPFGFYILYKELKTITNSKSVHEIKAIEEITKLNPKEDVILFINENNPYFDRKIINDSIQKFIAKGGTAFISNTSYQLEILHVETQDSILQKINQFQFNSNYNKYTNEAKYYSKAERNKSLATVTFTNETKTNYILINENIGKIYEHANPDLFTNLYLLSPKGYQYSKEVFKPFHRKNIYWINPNKPYNVNNENSPLSFILSQPELRSAWYIILACLFLFLLFKSKREQKQIPVIIPEQNLSLEFANVIASMYYENGKPNDIIKKKIDYFFYTIRKQFNSIAENIFDEQFIYTLAQKAQITEEETKQILTELQQLYNKKNASSNDVIKTYHIIENYKKESPNLMNTTEKYSSLENRIDVSDIQAKVTAIKQELRKVIVGQDEVINQLVIALLSNGHSLIEGLPGVAKTMMAKLLAKTIDSGFSRIQFTPDLMPSDVTGTSVLNMQNNQFEFKRGPIFSNIVLIDEINRSPAKTQAALFECMSENQITADGKTYQLDAPFLVFATQNPIEQEGTYRLPEAQLDRFMFKINVDYPSLEDEILLLTEQQERKNTKKESLVQAIIKGEEIIEFQQRIKSIFVHKDIIKFIATLVYQTRTDKNLYIGASPRASIAILDAAKALAAIDGRDFVIPEDVKNVAFPILGHRVVLIPEKEMEGYSTHTIIKQIIDRVEIPR